jgi:hypothetical protein
MQAFSLLIVLGLIQTVTANAQFRGPTPTPAPTVIPTITPVPTPALDQELMDLANDVRAAQFTLTIDQRTKIEDQIKMIRKTLNNSRSQGAYACVSRNNDGRSPFMLASSNGIKMQKIQGTLYQKSADCQAADYSIRILPTTSLACTSRDQDGRGPWIMGLLNEKNQFVRLDNAVALNLADCLKLEQDLVLQEDQTTGLFCASKGGDGKSPFVMTKVDLLTGRLEWSSQIFSDLQHCNQNLGFSQGY